MNKDESTTAAL